MLLNLFTFADRYLQTDREFAQCDPIRTRRPSSSSSVAVCLPRVPKYLSLLSSHLQTLYRASGRIMIPVSQWIKASLTLLFVSHTNIVRTHLKSPFDTKQRPNSSTIPLCTPYLRYNDAYKTDAFPVLRRPPYTLAVFAYPQLNRDHPLPQTQNVWNYRCTRYL
jgi:hypothetical protein